MGLNEVSNILWRERHLLELLLFKLEEEQLILASGRARLLARATREVEMVLEEIQRAEMERAIEVDALAADLGLPPNPSLRQLTDAVDEPWKSVFAFHRQGFLEATETVVSLANANKDLLSHGYRAAQQALAALVPEEPLEAMSVVGGVGGAGGIGGPSGRSPIYSPTGAPAVSRPAGRLVNEAL